MIIATSDLMRNEQMAFDSILFPMASDRTRSEIAQAQDFFGDLQLDRIVRSIIADKDEYDLEPFFRTPLHDTDSIAYRHEVMRDLENPSVHARLTSFEEGMRTMRGHLARAGKLRYPYQKDRWFLQAVDGYCDALTHLARNLAETAMTSRGLLAFRDYVHAYVASDAFVSLDAEAKRLAALLATVRYSILICDDGFRVAGYEPAPDYGADIEETFAKFAQGTVKDYAVTFAENPEMNSIEEKVLEFVARLEPDIFCGLHAFATDNATFVDSVVATFDREVQFYFASLAYISKFERAGLPMCYPEVTDTDKAISSRDGFDLALADKLIDEHSRVVCNDFFLEHRERVLVVSGPNQGGKTTFARAFGQMHYLASLGCQVSGRQARLFLFDRIFTHFERPEDVTTLRGKLEDDLIRMRDILDQATPKSIVIMNEIFTSTTLSMRFGSGRRYSNA